MLWRLLACGTESLSGSGKQSPVPTVCTARKCCVTHCKHTLCAISCCAKHIKVFTPSESQNSPNSALVKLFMRRENYLYRLTLTTSVYNHEAENQKLCLHWTELLVLCLHWTELLVLCFHWTELLVLCLHWTEFLGDDVVQGVLQELLLLFVSNLPFSTSRIQ